MAHHRSPALDQSNDARSGRRIRASAPATWLSQRITPSRHSLLHDEPFRIWWLTRFACQTAQGALLYALLIIVVDRTDASFYSSLFVVASLAPALVFGLPGGIVSDRLPKRPLMVGLNLARFRPTIRGRFGRRSLTIPPGNPKTRAGAREATTNSEL